MNVWNNDATNMINGTDGTLWNPYVDKLKPLYLFAPEVCRSVSFVYQKPSNVCGVSTYRYQVNPQESQMPNFYPRNAGYGFKNCLNGNLTDTVNINKCCLGKGVFSLLYCKDAEFVLTGSHMYGSEQFINDIKGINKPSSLVASTWIEIDPITGRPLCGNNNVQKNFYIRKTKILENVYD
ncbi:hypothetical protein A3Q56_01308 [Intoshia linei]|uniref:Uncharacterized protein n=1 Tax=Intoshia linei TaxID=1819745 RepID=A0A177BB78_9BILA|nr:hypothetical protein A3Q56_01308 [Intoshia linei]